MTANPALVGIMMMIAAVALLTTMSMLVKLIGPDYHPAQVTFLRSLVAMVVIIPILMRVGGFRQLKTRRTGLHIWRSLAGVAGNMLFFYCFQRMAVGDVVVISQAVPIFVAVLAVLLLGERVGWRRWLAILVGFSGVIVAIKPAGDFQTISLLAVAATGFWASTILFMRKLGETESPYAVAFYFMLIGAMVTGAAQPWVWVTPTREVLILLIGVGICGAFGQILMTYALKLAKASVISPFNYTGILWAMGFDLLIWDMAPQTSTLIGAAIIVATGIYIFHREAIVRQTDR